MAVAGWQTPQSSSGHPRLIVVECGRPVGAAVTDGAHIGQIEQVSSEVVPPETVESELLRIGNDGSFFSTDDNYDPAAYIANSESGTGYG
jgi:hypothetical protein